MSGSGIFSLQQAVEEACEKPDLNGTIISDQSLASKPKFDFDKSLEAMEYLPTIDASDNTTFKHVVRTLDSGRDYSKPRRRRSTSKSDEDNLSFNSIKRVSKDSQDADSEPESLDQFLKILELLQNEDSNGIIRELDPRVSSVDIVSDLFDMSNDLRVERERISTRKTEEDIDAFVNRDATMKYNTELDEVVARLKEEEKIRTRAASLRRQSVASPNNIDSKDMSMFWSHLLNKQTVVKKETIKRRVSLRSSLEVKGVESGLRRFSSIRENDEDDQDDEDSDEDEEDNVAELEALYSEAGAESILEDNLSLLLKTKFLAADKKNGKNSFLLKSPRIDEATKIKMQLERLHSSASSDTFRSNLKKRYYGIKHDYSYVQSRLFDYENSQVKSTLLKRIKKTQEKLLQLSTQYAMLKSNHSIQHSFRAKTRKKVYPDLDVETFLSPAKSVVKVNNKIIYDIADDFSDTNYHPYSDLYAGNT
jgi:hypothetical protein